MYVWVSGVADASTMQDGETMVSPVDLPIESWAGRCPLPEQREALLQDALRLRHGPPHDLARGGDVANDALHLANRPDARIQVALFEDAAPACTRHKRLQSGN